jgi:hypothetical protein
MTNRITLLILALGALLASAVYSASTQDARFATVTDTNPVGTTNLVFSPDGLRLREAQWMRAATAGCFDWVRAITYDVKTGSIRHVSNFQPDAFLFSITPDGRSAIISVDRDRKDARAHLLLADMDTGITQDIPAKWFAPDDNNPFAQISGDGRTVSAYTESDSENGRVVTLYDWATKLPIAKQSEGHSAGGFDGGGVTADGKIEFSNNRTGGDVVDPKTGRLLVTVAPNSYRSPDGAWVVEFPNTLYGDTPREVVIKNGNSGEVAGKLELSISDDSELERWAWARGAFCGTSGRFVAATNNTVQAFAIPSGKRIADFPKPAWQDALAQDSGPVEAVGCTFDGKRVAVRSGTRLTLHDLK